MTAMDRCFTVVAFPTPMLIFAAASPKRAMPAIESPCNKVCAVDPVSSLCVGCGRSLAEIEAWTRLTSDERAEIMADLPRRMNALHRLHDTPADAS
jgi:uncharacterized protein